MDAMRAESGADHDLDRGVWGANPSARQVNDAAALNLSIAVARRRRVIDASDSRRGVAEALGKSEQSVSAMLERQALLGLKVGREWRIPAWQMAPGLSAGILPGLRELAMAHLGGVVSLSEWVQRPNPDLDGSTPREALLRGAIAEVVAAARTE